MTDVAGILAQGSKQPEPSRYDDIASALSAFFSREAGQKRRAALDDAVEYYTPPELRGIFGMANELNPVTSMERAGQASNTMFAPETDGWARLQALGDMSSNIAGVVAPAVAAKYGGVPVANAIEESLMGWSAAPRAGLDDFIADESGALNLGAKQSPAQSVADMLASGRADDVTDDMMAAVDPQEMWRLYESGATGQAMPMDFASRMARAEEMGFDTGMPLYHGSKIDFQAMDPTKIAPHNARGRGFYMTDSQSSASGYSGGANMQRMDLNIGSEQNVSPLFAGGRVLDERSIMSPKDIAAIDDFAADHFDKSYPANGSNVLQEFSYKPNEQNAALMKAGYSGRIGPGIVDGRDAVIFDPANIRSKFARFDPRLKHLANLSAGIGGLGYFAPSDNGDIQSYLDKLE